MRCIARHGGEPLARVAEELEMDRTSLYRAITPMEREGWIELGAGINARSRSAKITHKGTLALVKAASEWDQLQRNLIKTFGKAEWGILAGELRRLGECAERLTTL
jgi:DNA-binding MarR family transcriptional regulator